MEIALFSDFPVLVEALLKSMLFTVLQLLAFLGVFILVGFLIDRMERKRNGWIRSTVGDRGIYATALIGVPVHEIGHALMCLVFGHKVEQIKLVQFGAPGEALGYVNHSFDPNNLFHRIGQFFIGIAPIIMGIAFITVTLYFTLPDTFHGWTEAVMASEELADIPQTLLVLVTSLFSGENFTNPLFYLFLLLAIGVASHMSLSQSDIAGARTGLIAMYILLVIYNLLYLAAKGGEVSIANLFLNDYNFFVLSISMIALLFAGIATLLAYAMYRVKRIAG